MLTYLDCRRHKVLPVAGGLMDQDPKTLSDFALIESTIAEVKEQNRGA